MELKEKLAKSRVLLDKKMQEVNLLRGNRRTNDEGVGREVSMCFTSLQMGRMWLGEVLHGLGEAYPYEGTNQAKTPEEIKKAVHTYEGDIEVKRWKDGNIIDNLGDLRNSIDYVIDAIHEDYLAYMMQKEALPQDKVENVIKTFNLNQAYMSSFTHLREARMILGVAMGKIRDNHVKN